VARLNPQGVQALKDRLSRLALQGAQAGADVLQEKLSGEGTGVHYAGQPRRASAPGEYPSLQSGDLRDSISARSAGPLAAEFGPLSNPPVQAGYLHFSNEEAMLAMHFREPARGGRPFLDMALADEDVRDAIKKEVGI